LTAKGKASSGQTAHERIMPSQQKTPVSVSVGEETATVAVHGDFDMAATFTVEPAVEAALQQPGLRAITLDLSGLSFIDSTGMNVIVKLETEARANDIALAIVPAPRHVQRVFEVSGLGDTLPFRPG
jgi:anti-anti-sigma factor